MQEEQHQKQNKQQLQNPSLLKKLFCLCCGNDPTLSFNDGQDQSIENGFQEIEGSQTPKQHNPIANKNHLYKSPYEQINQEKQSPSSSVQFQLKKLSEVSQGDDQVVTIKKKPVLLVSDSMLHMNLNNLNSNFTNNPITNNLTNKNFNSNNGDNKEFFFLKHGKQMLLCRIGSKDFRYQENHNNKYNNNNQNPNNKSQSFQSEPRDRHLRRRKKDTRQSQIQNLPQLIGGAGNNKLANKQNLNKEQEDAADSPINFMHKERDLEFSKHFSKLANLFSNIHDIKVDVNAYSSVIPEKIAQHIALKAKQDNCHFIIDAFCGVGGTTIQFAKQCDLVIAIDVDYKRALFTQHNLRQYGLELKADVICADFQKCLRKVPLSFSGNKQTYQQYSRPDLVFLHPDTKFLRDRTKNKRQKFSLLKHLVPGVTESLSKALSISDRVYILLPKEANICHFASLVYQYFDLQRLSKNTAFYRNYNYKIEIEFLTVNRLIYKIGVHIQQNVQSLNLMEECTFMAHFINLSFPHPTLITASKEIQKLSNPELQQNEEDIQEQSSLQTFLYIAQNHITTNLNASEQEHAYKYNELSIQVESLLKQSKFLLLEQHNNQVQQQQQSKFKSESNTQNMNVKINNKRSQLARAQLVINNTPQQRRLLNSFRHPQQHASHYNQFENLLANPMPYSHQQELIRPLNTHQYQTNKHHQNQHNTNHNNIENNSSHNSFNQFAHSSSQNSQHSDDFDDSILDGHYGGVDELLQNKPILLSSEDDGSQTDPNEQLQSLQAYNDIRLNMHDIAKQMDRDSLNLNYNMTKQA